MRILVCDDDRGLRGALRRALTLDGYDVEVAGDGAAALSLVKGSAPDAIVLDVLMPLMNGFEVCRQLREAEITTPVLILTVRDDVSDVVAGLDVGADDYLTKPFALVELRARLRALLRRSGLGGKVLTFDDLHLDTTTREVIRGDRRLILTRTEFTLLELLMRHPREPLTREFISERVWGFDPGRQASSLDVYVGYLRRKLEGTGQPRLLHTVRGVGYVLRTADAFDEVMAGAPVALHQAAGDR